MRPPSGADTCTLWPSGPSRGGWSAREEEARPAQAPALEDPEGFDTLSDDLVLRALLRAPFVCHGTLHAVCQRFKSLLRSDDFRKQRLEFGLVEHGLVFAGGRRGGHTIAECRMLSGGRWRPIRR